MPGPQARHSFYVTFLSLGALACCITLTQGLGVGTQGLRVAGCFLDELYAGAQAEFGVDVGEVGLHGAW